MCIDDGSECSSWSKSLSLKAAPTSGNIAVKHDNMELKVTTVCVCDFVGYSGPLYYQPLN